MNYERIAGKSACLTWLQRMSAYSAGHNLTVFHMVLLSRRRVWDSKCEFVPVETNNTKNRSKHNKLLLQTRKRISTGHLSSEHARGAVQRGSVSEYIHVYVYMYIYIYNVYILYVCIHIYIYIERERDVYMYRFRRMYIYIYMYIECSIVPSQLFATARAMIHLGGCDNVFLCNRTCFCESALA